jgi:hypothetical protein
MSTRRGWLANGKWIACEDTTCTPENEQKKTGPSASFLNTLTSTRSAVGANVIGIEIDVV